MKLPNVSRQKLRKNPPNHLKNWDSNNTTARHEIQNTCGLKITGSKTEQYKSSFSVRTAADWNKLEDTVVTALSPAVGRVLQGAASHT